MLDTLVILGRNPCEGRYVTGWWENASVEAIDARKLSAMVNSGKAKEAWAELIR